MMLSLWSFGVARLGGFLMRDRSVWACLPILASLFSMFMVMPASAQGIGIDSGAAGDSLGPTGEVSDRWHYTLGLGAVAVPDYEGSEDYEAAPLPVTRAQKGYQYGQLFGLKITSNLIPHPNFRLGPVINFRGERVSTAE